MDQKDTIKELIEENQEELISLLSELVSFNTQNPPGDNYPQMVEFLEKRCQALGMKTRKVTVDKSFLKEQGIDLNYPRITLLAEMDNKKKKWLHLNSHYDVVPADAQSWSSDPYKAVQKDGRLLGRGTYDMKAFIAAKLFALKVLGQAGIVPKYDIQLSFVPDEETGGLPGFKYVFDKGLIKADYAIGEGEKDEYIGYGNKGILWFEVEMIGKPAHAAHPFDGVNAFEHMSLLIAELSKLKVQVEKRKTAHGVRDIRQKNASFVMGGLSQGGTKINTVPGRCMFSIDRRVLPDENMAAAEKEIRDVIDAFAKKHKQIKVAVKLVQSSRPVIIDIKNSFCDAFSRIVTEEYGKKAKFVLMSGGTDIRYLAWKGVPCISYAPAGDNMHGDDEYVSIKSLVTTTRILARAIASLD